MRTSRLGVVLTAAVALTVLTGTPAHANSTPAKAVVEASITSQAVPAIWNGCSNTTYKTGVPTKCFYQDWQGFTLKRYGYTGSIDGVMGPASWKATQRMLKAAGRNPGPIDGVPGVQTKKALQQFLRVNGRYTGPIDGILGAGSYRAWGLYTLGSAN